MTIDDAFYGACKAFERVLAAFEQNDMDAFKKARDEHIAYAEMHKRLRRSETVN